MPRWERLITRLLLPIAQHGLPLYARAGVSRLPGAHKEGQWQSFCESEAGVEQKGALCRHHFACI
jgi:hypothetical protein